MEATKMSFNSWVGKYSVVHPDNGILFSDKSNWAIKPWKDIDEPQNTVLFQLYDILEKAKLWRTKRSAVLPGTQGEEGRDD